MVKDTKTQNDVIGQLFEAGAHFGYARSRRHPSVAAYIFGAKNKVEIVDLEKTVAQLEAAKKFVSELAAAGKQILFVGGKSEAKSFMKLSAESAGLPYVAGRWIGGTITNAPEIKKRIALFEDLQKQKEKGELSKYTKKERLLIDRKIENLSEMFSGIVSLKDAPKALFVIDPKREFIAVAEAKKAGIPVIALANTDCDITVIDYPIVANDASVSSIAFFAHEIAGAYKAGKAASK